MVEEVNEFLESTMPNLATKLEAKDFVKVHNGNLKDYYRVGKATATCDFGEVRLCVHRETAA